MKLAVASSKTVLKRSIGSIVMVFETIFAGCTIDYGAGRYWVCEEEDEMNVMTERLVHQRRALKGMRKSSFR